MLGASFISPGITHLLTRSYFSLFTSTVPDWKKIWNAFGVNKQIL
jgi:hypothetical protein